MDVANEELNAIRTIKNSKLLSDNGEKTMKLLKKKKLRYEKKLKRLEQLRLSQAKYRSNKKLKLKRLLEKHPDAAAEYNLALYDQGGQPCVEDRGQSSLIGS